MRIAFFGHRRIARGSLESLVEAGASVVGIVAHPEAFEPADPEWTAAVRSLAGRAGIPLETPGTIDAAFLAKFREWKVDLGIVVGYLAILKPPLLQMPRLGFVNVHAGMLPRYRGRAPLSWAIMNGEEEAGLTVHFIDEGVDSGPIITQRAYAIGENETAGALYTRIEGDIPNLLLDVVGRFERGSVEGIPQDEERAMCFPSIRPEHARIDWSRSAGNIHDQIRALSRPYPGAWTRYRGKKMIIWKARPLGIELPECFPGTVVNRWPGKGIVVSTGMGYLLVEEAEIEGKEAGPADRSVRRAGVSLGLVSS